MHSDILLHINCFIEHRFIQCKVLVLLFILLKHITICLTRFLWSRPFFIVFNQFDMVLLPRIFIHRKQENIHAILSGFNCLQLPKKNKWTCLLTWNHEIWRYLLCFKLHYKLNAQSWPRVNNITRMCLFCWIESCNLYL